MIFNVLTSALRSFRKNKLHSTINILGLSIGLTASTLAFMFVLDERSFDQFHSKLDRLYRLNKISTESDGSTFLNGESSGMMGPTMVTEFPEVENMTRYQTSGNMMLSYGDRSVELQGGENLFVDSTFFEIFDFKLVEGDPKTVLTRPSTIVLTEEIAKILFQDEDPIGKAITGMNNLQFEVTGIADRVPRNSHIQYKSLISWSTTVPDVGPLNRASMNNWISQSLSTYILLKPDVNVHLLQRKFAKFMQDHIPTRVDSYSLYLQPFRDVYLSAGDIKYHRMAKTGNKQYVIIFSVIAIFILVIACVNYINISTSRSTRRAREVGMRKSLGATRAQLIRQFMGESFLITLLSALAAIVLLYIAIPYFNTLAGKTLPVSLLLNFKVIGGLIGLILTVALFSGSYPAFVLAAFKPAEVLKSSSKNKVSGHWPRYVLITFQFAISIVMIAGTLVIYRQMKFILSKDLGFDKEQVLVVNLTDEIILKGETFEQEVNQHSAVVSSSLSPMALGRGSSSTYVIPEGFKPDEIEIRMFPVDGNFQKTYQLELVDGRFFNLPLMANDSNAVIINETLARQLNWNENALEKTIRFDEQDQAHPVIGVLKDFNFKSLYEEIEPVVMWVGQDSRRSLSIRFEGNPADLISFLETKWKSYESRYPFNYYFVDEAYANLYQSEDKLFRTIITFSVISLVIACLGLYGLVSFTLEQRTREFGIRKVLGATVASLNFMVNRNFIIMVLLAGCITVPVLIPMLNSWLSKFAFKTTIGPDVFLLATGITLVITLLAVSLQAVRAAMMNPAKSLRSE